MVRVEQIHRGVASATTQREVNPSRGKIDSDALKVTTLGEIFVRSTDIYKPKQKAGTTDDDCTWGAKSCSGRCNCK